MRPWKLAPDFELRTNSGDFMSERPILVVIVVMFVFWAMVGTFSEDI